jgi:hypothetical protein
MATRKLLLADAPVVARIQLVILLRELRRLSCSSAKTSVVENDERLPTPKKPRGCSTHRGGRSRASARS